MTVDYGFAFHFSFMLPAARVDACHAGIAELRASRVRMAAWWPTIQPTRDTFVWAGTDYAVNSALDHGLKPLILVNGRPGWGPAASDYGAFAKLVAQRYAPGVGVGLSDANKAANRGIREYELWNEENQFFFWQSIPVSPNDYTAYCKAAYSGIKQVLPGSESTVLLGGMNPTGEGGFGFMAQSPYNFLKSCYAAGIKGSFDAVAMHPYTLDDPGGPRPTTTSPYIAMTDQLHDLMVANGEGSKQIWCTEYGLATPTTVSEALQSQYYQEFVDIWTAKSYTGPFILYEYSNQGVDIGDREQMFGVVDNSLNKKASWFYLNSINAVMSAPMFGGVGSLGMAARTSHTPEFGTCAKLECSVQAVQFADAAFGGAGMPSASAEPTGRPAAAFTASGALYAAAKQSFSVSALFSGAGAPAAARELQQPVVAAFGGSGLLSASSGVFLARKTFSYDFAAHGSTKPTTLFTDFGAGYQVNFGLANNNNVGSNGEYYSGGMYTEDHVSFDHYCQVIVGNGGGDSFDRSPMPLVRGNEDGSNWVGAYGHFPSANGCGIVTNIGGVRQTRASSTTGFTSDDQMVLTAVGNVYSLYKNPGASLDMTGKTPVVTWTDSTNAYTPYQGKRTGFGFQHIYSAANYGTSGIWKVWKGADLADSIAVSVPGANFGGSGAFAASTLPTFNRTAAFTGVGTANDGVVVIRTPTFGGSGIFVADTIPSFARTADFSATGFYAAVQNNTVDLGTVPFTGSGGLAAPAVASFSRTAAMTGSGTLAATATPYYAVTAGFSSTGAPSVALTKLINNYTFSGSTKPTTWFNDWGAGSFSVSGGIAIEGPSTTVDGIYYSGGLNTQPTFTNLHYSQVTTAAFGGGGADRGHGAVVASDSSATNLVFAVGRPFGGGGIYSKVGSTITLRTSFGVGFVENDVLKLAVTHNGTNYVYTATKNGGSAITWTDTGNVITPGKYVGFAFQHTYASGQFYSSGIKGTWTGADT